MKRIIFLNRFFFPDDSATSQILSDLAFHLAGLGFAVEVFASRQRYDDSQADLPALETIRGVTIHRLATTRFGRGSLLGRAIDYLSFYVLAGRSLLACAKAGDILVVKTDPPLLCVPAAYAAKRRGLRLVNWLQDLYPEVAAELGVSFARGLPGRALSHLRDASLRAASANVVIGSRMAEAILSRGISPETIHVIPNWCDDEDIRPVDHASNPLRREWGLENHFVIGYSGNLGRAHEFETLLTAAGLLKNDPRFVFLFIGGAGRFDAVRDRVRELGLDRSFRFRPYQNRDVLKLSLGVADIHWVSLKPELEGFVVPSKFYGIAAAGRAIVAVASTEGELAQLIRDHGCGVSVETGSGQELCRVINELSADPKRVAEMGHRACAMLDSHFSRRRAFEQWERVIRKIG